MPTAEPRLDPKTRRLVIIGMLFNIVLLAGAWYFLIGRPSQQQPAAAPSAIGGPFSMTDQVGRTVTDATLRGKPFALFFGFTRCPDVCPTTLNRLAKLRKTLGRDGNRFNIVFVSVDPGHDKPADIRQYLALFETPMIGLSGTPDQLAAMIKAFHVYYRKVPLGKGVDDYTVDHTATIFLMDADGKFVTTIDHAESETMAIAKLKRLMR